jgi:hypothetical protein
MYVLLKGAERNIVGISEERIKLQSYIDSFIAKNNELLVLQRKADEAFFERVVEWLKPFLEDRDVINVDALTTAYSIDTDDEAIRYLARCFVNRSKSSFMASTFRKYVKLPMRDAARMPNQTENPSADYEPNDGSFVIEEVLVIE